MTNETGYGWNDDLPPPKEFVLMPEGDAQFEVLKMERARRDWGKLGTVNVADLTLRVVSFAAPDDPQELEAAIPLHPKMAWKAYQFFASIGQYKHGDVEAGKPFRPNWAKVEGACGCCTIKHRPWKNKAGKEMKSPEVNDFLDEQGRSRASDPVREVGAQPASDNLKF